MSDELDLIPFEFEPMELKESLRRSEQFYQQSNARRSVRDFSDREVPLELIQNLVLTAGTAPSGAHKQPWTFCIISNQELKRKIRAAAEEEEYESYHGRMSEQWLHDLKAIGTDWRKPFLEIAPWLIVVFKRPFEFVDGKKWQNYYVNESVGIACGMLINAIHNAGLVTLTHTPSPMNFLTEILERPVNERPYLLLPVGYPSISAHVPNLHRKSFEEIAVMHD